MLTKGQLEFVLAAIAAFTCDDADEFALAMREDRVASWLRERSSEFDFSALGFTEDVVSTIRSQLSELEERSDLALEIHRRFDRNHIFPDDMQFGDDPIRAGTYIAKALKRHDLAEKKAWRDIYINGQGLLEALRQGKADSAMELIVS